MKNHYSFACTSGIISFGIPLALLLLPFFLFFSCDSNELSRGKAKVEIINEYAYPYPETMKLEKVYIKSHATSAPGGWLPKACLVSGPIFSNVKDLIGSIEQRGLVTVSENGPLGECRVVQAVIKLTPEGQKYLVQETKDQWIVARAQISFGEVTGIQTYEQFNAAEVGDGGLNKVY